MTRKFWEHKHPRRFNPRNTRASNKQLSFVRLEAKHLLASIVVDTGGDNSADDGLTTLREAIETANILDGADNIYFDSDLNESTIFVESELKVTDSLTIHGLGAYWLTVAADEGVDRVFNIDDGTADKAQVKIRHITIANGGDAEANINGSAIRSVENLTVESVSFENNNSGTGDGGAIHSSQGDLVVRDSVFTGNMANNGGAVFAEIGSAKIINSTLSGNTASVSGGGVAFDGSTLTIRNATIVDNRALSTSLGDGGGVFGFGTSTLEMHNVIVAGNELGSIANDLGSSELAGIAPLSSHNLIGDSNSSLSLTHGVSGNLVGINGSGTVEIGSVIDTALSYNGGNTRTHALIPTSPAVNAGANSQADDENGIPLEDDQRRFNYYRIWHGTVDIGAFESRYETPSLHVTTDSDDDDPTDGLISLREAIAFANNPNVGDMYNGDADNDGDIHDTITFPYSSSATEIDTFSPLTISSPLTINGRGAPNLIVSGRNDHQVFVVDDLDDNNEIDVVIKQLTITDGFAANGGGIYSRENLTLELVKLEENHATLGGGGLSQEAGLLTLQSSTFYRNSTDGNGGGLEIDSDATVEMVNATVSGNSAGLNGGGIFNSGNSSAVVRSTTIAINKSDNLDDGGQGGGIFVESGSVALFNTILVGNENDTSEIPDDVGGSLHAQSSHNLVSDYSTSGGLVDKDNGNIVGAGTGTIRTDRVLSTVLWDSAGPGYHSLDFHSPAIGVGNNDEVTTTTDQTGWDRIKVGTVDLGSVESSSEQIDFVVDTVLLTNDSRDGLTSFTEALSHSGFLDADLDGSPIDSITFDLPEGSTIDLTDEYRIRQSLNIIGPGADQLTLRGAGDHRIFEVNDWNDFTTIDVLISGLTIANGFSNRGSGISSVENLTLDGVALVDNVSSYSAGALFQAGEKAPAELIIRNSTFSGNEAATSGGAISLGAVEAQIENSTFSGNSAGLNGGGIYLYVDATMSIRNSTITGNRADSDEVDGGIGGGATASNSSLTLHNSIVAGNFRGASQTPDDIGESVEPESSHNIVGAAATSGGLTHGLNGNIVGVNGVGTIDTSTVLNVNLADNGGPTATHAIFVGSPAIDAGNNSEAVDASGNPLTTDQRGAGFNRFSDGLASGANIVDIGAVELDTTSPTIQSIAFNSGGDQRSIIREIPVTFDEIVNVDSNSFMLENLDSGVCFTPDVTVQVINGKTVATLTFSEPGFIGGSLPDGNYRLTTLGTITDASGNQLDGNGDGTAGGNATDEFFRLYGDINGSGNVNIFDLLPFRTAYNQPANYDPNFDFNNDGVINIFDLLQFRNRYGTSI